ncbi:mannose-1-phosphate guanylyltransferase [Rufibacter glacialis]|uniref:mannose-1-phosphate guanylyltransferase n=1 Tax=Rufibacter glacialis TaxID=1259555 RepID=A0A5M8QQQ3_9BACT|nr:mannose-1-phosphate guanylyltransferase [Rufibacter glacialis]KAA6437571.1 mannose-1-phosphate guanylyltransferase [Rufibacter glacialis]GGK58225.1 mannose-1-phosphate guanylyltransferase [Rufibacter glacialis]
MNDNTYVVIMAGGIGSRFWPFSRVNHPKQFHDVLGIGESMIQTTVKRFEGICPPENIFVVTHRDYAYLVREHLPDLTENQILQEPIGRNTAPCIAYACFKIAKRNPNANIVIAPADHVILREEAFKTCIKEALKATAASEILVTLGIKPTRPHTGYGYIQFIGEEGQALKKVKTFTEKPSLEIAQMFLDSGEFVWNAGIFIWNAQAIIKAFHQYLGDMAETFEEGIPVLDTDDEERFINRAYSHCPNISIDYGIMEKADNVFVILGDFGWSDLGSWDSLYSLSEKTPEGNVIDGNVLTYDVKNCIVKTPQNQLVVLQGLEDYIVAAHDNVFMVCRREDEQKVKDFVADAKAMKGQNFM